MALPRDQRLAALMCAWWMIFMYDTDESFIFQTLQMIPHEDAAEVLSAVGITTASTRRSPRRSRESTGQDLPHRTRHSGEGTGQHSSLASSDGRKRRRRRHSETREDIDRAVAQYAQMHEANEDAKFDAFMMIIEGTLKPGGGGTRSLASSAGAVDTESRGGGARASVFSTEGSPRESGGGGAGASESLSTAEEVGLLKKRKFELELTKQQGELRHRARAEAKELYERARLAHAEGLCGKEKLKEVLDAYLSVP